jgi:hypothetical protein
MVLSRRLAETLNICLRSPANPFVTHTDLDSADGPHRVGREVWAGNSEELRIRSSLLPCLLPRWQEPAGMPKTQEDNVLPGSSMLTRVFSALADWLGGGCLIHPFDRFPTCVKTESTTCSTVCPSVGMVWCAAAAY